MKFLILFYFISYFFRKKQYHLQAQVRRILILTKNFGNADDDAENAPLTPAVSDEKSFKY